MGSVNKMDIKGMGTMELSGGILYLRWKPGVNTGIDAANAAIAAIATLGQRARWPMLVEIQGVTHSAAARKVFPDPSTVSRVALLGSSPVDRVIAMFRLPLLPTGYPVRYFTSKDKALEWLLESSGETDTSHGDH